MGKFWFYFFSSSNYSIRAAIAHLTSKVDYIIENIDASVQKFGRIPKNEFNHLLREFKKSGMFLFCVKINYFYYDD